jgi:putative ABC transport system ATP-binding protein
MLAIDAHGLLQHFGRGAERVLALDEVSLTVERGEWVAVTGPSGCGKTTLLHVLGGLALPEHGTVRIGDAELTGLSESARARMRRTHVGYVFQQYNLVSELDVIGNVELPLALAGVPRRTARARALAELQRLGVADRAHVDPTRLSGGQQQRVALARALITRPAVVLADEPTGALDSHAAGLVVDALRDAHRAGQTIVMVTHAPELAALADRVVSMRDGRIVDASYTVGSRSGAACVA